MDIPDFLQSSLAKVKKKAHSKNKSSKAVRLKTPKKDKKLKK
jgi:hypothetical protein